MITFTTPTWSVFPPRDWQRAALSTACTHLAGFDPEPTIISAIMGAGKSILIGEICGTAELESDEVIVVSTSTELLVLDLSSMIKERTGDCGVWYGRKKRLSKIIVTCLPSTASLARKLKSVGKTVLLWIADEVHRSESETVLSANRILEPIHALGMTATPFRSSRMETLSLFNSVLYRYGVSEARRDGVVVPWRIEHDDIGGDLNEACLRYIRQAEGPGLANATSIADADEFASFATSNGVPTKSIHSRLKPAEKQKVLNDLKVGNLKAIVHVNMLTEGANYPWLMWMVLRRQVDSRVRFIQEIGRLLRSHPGKDEAIFFDPHDLFGQFKLVYEEALGVAPEPKELAFEVKTPEEAGERILDHDPAIALAWVESLIRGLIVSCDAYGLLDRRKIIKKNDRLHPSNSLQKVAIEEIYYKARIFIPDDWNNVFGSILERPELLRFGFASDLIAALEAINKNEKWPGIGVRKQKEKESNPFVIGKGGQMEMDFGRL